MRNLLAMAMLGALSACGASDGIAPAPIPVAPAGPMASAYGKPRELIGMDAKRLIQMFGTPRLDIRDRAVRKLQFANGRCVLDAYLYTPAKGKEPVTTHVDSRLPSGTDTDVAACAGMLTVK